jgi:hypothetical protein
MSESIINMGTSVVPTNLVYWNSLLAVCASQMKLLTDTDSEFSQSAPLEVRFSFGMLVRLMDIQPNHSDIDFTPT